MNELDALLETLPTPGDETVLPIRPQENAAAQIAAGLLAADAPVARLHQLADALADLCAQCAR